MKLAAICICLLFLTGAFVCRAQQVSEQQPYPQAAIESALPDKPEPLKSYKSYKSDKSERIQVERPFLDRPAEVVMGTNFALATLDTVGTCRTLAVGGHERWLPTQQCAPASLLIYGNFALDVSVAYILHRTGHRKLERITELVSTAGSVSGVAYTVTHGGRW